MHPVDEIARPLVVFLVMPMLAWTTIGLVRHLLSQRRDRLKFGRALVALDRVRRIPSEHLR